jgi:hypothetical protein
MSMRYVLKCSVCNVPLTGPLEQLQHASMLGNEDQKNRAPVGSFGIEHGHFVVHLQDAVNTKQHPDTSRSNGCCGLSGSDGLNTVCLNGHEVATERSDCCVAHSMTFDRNAAWLDRIWLDES